MRSIPFSPVTSRSAVHRTGGPSRAASAATPRIPGTATYTIIAARSCSIVAVPIFTCSTSSARAAVESTRTGAAITSRVFCSTHPAARLTTLCGARTTSTASCTAFRAD